MAAVVRNALATVLVGALLGYVVVGLGGPMMDQMALFGNREAGEAKRYMIGILENEPETLSALTPKADLVSRAMQFKESQEAQGQWRAISLTYLGGKASGPLGVHMYAIELRSAQGREQFIPLALTIANGKVIRRE
ncbi:hypothetical protein BH18CHL2_BH18CHL2_07220 [soil metagenome]